jgi:hypothetical protein
MSDTDAPETPTAGQPLPPLEPTQALEIVAQACARYQGDLAAHQTIQRALQTIQDVMQSALAATNGDAISMNREQRRAQARKSTTTKES